MAAKAAGRRRFGFAALAAALLAVATAAFGGGFASRLGLDPLLPAASRLAPGGERSRVALIVVDETTHRTAPFSETPDVAWTPYLAQVLDAVAEAGPAVVGLDLIYSKTLDEPGLAPGFDRPFLAALARLGRPGKLVMGEARLSDAPIRPYRGQVIAVGGEANLRSVHFAPDPDNVVRRHPAGAVLEDGRAITNFATEIARRAGAQAKGDFLIDFASAPERFAAYRLSDLRACAAAGRTEAFAAFKDKAVLVGEMLDLEDRHLAANRLVRVKQPPILRLDCGQAGAAAPEPARATTSGVLIVARAVDTLLSGSAPRVLAWPWRLALSAALFLPLTLGFLRLSPPGGLALLAGFVAAAWAAAVLALGQGLVLPWLAWSLGGAGLLVAAHGYRVIVEGRARKRVTHAFSHYLSPALVERLAESADALKLGGEQLRVAVMFADLEGFTSFSEEHGGQPEVVVERLNDVFGMICDIAEEWGGYVDKFIGDAVMIVWGAPAAVEAPEDLAAHAAIAIRKAAEAAGIGLHIGLSAGPVIAGNLGSRQRFNYTVVGEAVNRAARLEKATRSHGVTVLADGEFVAVLTPGFDARHIGVERMRGMAREIELFELAGYDPPNQG